MISLKKCLFVIGIVLSRAGAPLFAQVSADSISGTSVEQTIRILASDSLMGRGNNTPGILKAAFYIGERFRHAGLVPFPGQPGYYVPFRLHAGVKTVPPPLPDMPLYAPGIGNNVVGILPGKSRPGEMILITAHYDHLGVSDENARDSIRNGANDNASGVTAVLALADYFAAKSGNERTLVFCLFAGEELGLLGSGQFLTLINPDSIIALINFEMIGLPQYGVGRVFITGSRYSNLQRLLDKKLAEQQVRVTGERSIEADLFKRSDNFPFVLRGVPAHTIMSSGDDEPCYHRPCDEVKRIHFRHMTRVIRGFAKALQPMIDGNETPSRIRPNSIRY